MNPCDRRDLRMNADTINCFDIVENSNYTEMQGRLIANKSQSFILGDYRISIKKDNQYHLENNNLD